MLYPKEDTAKRRAGQGRELVYACRNCDNKEPIGDASIPVYRNVIVHTAEYVGVFPLWGDSTFFARVGNALVKIACAALCASVLTCVRVCTCSVLALLMRGLVLLSFLGRSEQTTVTYDVASDPTLPRTYNAHCPSCGGTEAVYYQSPVGKNDEALVLVFVCVVATCQRTWLSSDADS